MGLEFRSGFLGRFDPSRRKVTVVGAGISGLLAAYFLQKQGVDVTVMEASSRAGGLIETVHTPWGLAERAAHSFLMSPSFKALIDELGIPILRAHPKHRARFILRQGRLRRFPLTVGESISMVGRMFSTKLPSAEQERLHSLSISQWGLRHLGPSGTKYLLEPLVAGIYAGDPGQMSWAAAFPALEAAAAQGQSFWRTFWNLWQARRLVPPQARGMFTFSGGSACLVDALARHLGPRLKMTTPVSDLNPLLQDGNVLLAVPAAAAGRLLVSGDCDAAAAAGAVGLAARQALAASLLKVESIPLVTATVFVRRQELRGYQEGVGVLIPVSEGLRIRGVLFNSSAFEGRVTPGSGANQEQIVSLTVMMGGAADPGAFELSEPELLCAIEEGLRQCLGLNENALRPLHLEVTRWPRALPHYTPALQKLWHEANQVLGEHPGVVLFGNYTGQVSVRGLVESASRLVF